MSKAKVIFAGIQYLLNKWICMDVHREPWVRIFRPYITLRQSFPREIELNSSVTVTRGWLELACVDATHHALGSGLASIPQDCFILLQFCFFHVILVPRHQKTWDSQAKQTKVWNYMNGFHFFPMEKKSVGRFCINEPKQQTGQRAGCILQFQQLFWALGF